MMAGDDDSEKKKIKNQKKNKTKKKKVQWHACGACRDRQFRSLHPTMHHTSFDREASSKQARPVPTGGRESD